MEYLTNYVSAAGKYGITFY